jgi:hypothetical protein
MASSFTLVVAGWSWFVFSLGQPVNRYALLISLGMVFGFLGDLFLASVLPAPDRVLAGIAAFAICHIFYILAIIGFGSRFGLNDPAIRWRMLGVWWLVGLAGWFFVVFWGQDRSERFTQMFPFGTFFLFHRIANATSPQASLPAELAVDNCFRLIAAFKSRPIIRPQFGQL